MHRGFKHIFATAAALTLVAPMSMAADFKPEEDITGYDHTRWGIEEDCLIATFNAYTSCFDNEDDDDGDGTADRLGVPEWVAYEIKAYDGTCIPTKERPSTWISDPSLVKKKLMPKDNSYATTKTFLETHKNWFERGHLLPKLIAARVGEAEEWNSHAMYNAVPQRSTFNAPIWFDLEELTGTWAQTYGSVWVITGPVFADRYAIAHLGDAGEIPVAIPDALYKIVIREGESDDKPEVLAFVYPQVGAGYIDTAKQGYDHSRYATNVDEIEALTGIDFFTALSETAQKRIEAQVNREIWPYHADDMLTGCSDPEKIELPRPRPSFAPS
ncbi:MAG TPA: DNA/RNA non-specific endonuclease [Alphaproteobacteria bacterium]